jgi:uridine kinase
VSPSRESVIHELTAHILALQLNHPTRVAVDGPDMAGKTVLADELAEEITKAGRETIRASADDFHRPSKQRYRRGRESPEGYYHDAFNLEGLVEVLLQPLGPAGDRSYRKAIFDWRTDKPVAAAPGIGSDDSVLIVDGVFLLRPELRIRWDFSIFVFASVGERLARSIVRDRESSGSREELERLYWSRYVPAHALYARAVAPEALADALVDNERPLAPNLVFRRQP